jgi:hypothetical protein
MRNMERETKERSSKAFTLSPIPYSLIYNDLEAALPTP